MGIPSFFREILTKYENTHFWDPNFVVKYLLLDYNAMIHKMVSDYFKTVEYDTFKKLSASKKDEKIIQFIIEKTLYFVNSVIKPEKLLYISIDGPAPRSKMELQRFRRYKSVKGEKYFSKLREKFDIKDPLTLWDKSANISPGTTFMAKLSSALWKAVKANKFMKGNIIVILSDSNRPGEGEHKILPFIRSLKNKNDSIVIYSPDADLIVLALSYAGNIIISRPKDKNSEEEMKKYPDTDYIYLSINKYRDAFLHKHKLINVDKIRFSRDLMFITFFGGNDFCRPIPFLKINKGGMNTIANVYKNVFRRLRKTENPYLVEMRKIKNDVIPLVNQVFLSEILQEFAKMEDIKMKEEYSRLLNRMSIESDKQAETFDEMKASFEHDKYYQSTHPFSNPEIFKVIDYNLPRNQWKDQYYEHFFGISPTNPREYRDYKRLICQTYLKGLEYTIRYYLTGLPSWKWHYPFRVAPLPSDILYFLKTVPANLAFSFDLGKPYTPLEQLAMIIPPQSSSALPRTMRNLLNSSNSPLIPFYPTNFELDILAGEKFIYSEPILPPIIDEIALPIIRSTFEKLPATDKKRNIVESTNVVYLPKKDNKIDDIAYPQPLSYSVDKTSNNMINNKSGGKYHFKKSKRPKYGKD
jgi:5'-3' exonuclease